MLGVLLLVIETMEAVYVHLIGTGRHVMVTKSLLIFKAVQFDYFCYIKLVRHNNLKSRVFRIPTVTVKKPPQSRLFPQSQIKLN